MVNVLSVNADVFYNFSRFLDCRTLCNLESVCKAFRDCLQKNPNIWHPQFDHEKFSLIEGKNRDFKQDFKVFYPITLSARRMLCLGEFVGKVPMMKESDFNMLQDWDPLTVPHSVTLKRAHDQAFSDAKKICQTHRIVVEPEFIRRKYVSSRDRELLFYLVRHGEGFELGEEDHFLKMEADKEAMSFYIEWRFDDDNMSWDQYVAKFLYVKDPVFLAEVKPYLQRIRRVHIEVDEFLAIIEEKYPTSKNCDTEVYLSVPNSSANVVILSLYPLTSKVETTPFSSESWANNLEYIGLAERVNISFIREKPPEKYQDLDPRDLESLVTNTKFSLPSARQATLFNVVEILNTGKCPVQRQGKMTYILTNDRNDEGEPLVVRIGGESPAELEILPCDGEEVQEVGTVSTVPVWQCETQAIQ